VWGNSDYPEGDYSDGLCKICFRDKIRPLIHRRQLKEGFTPCYGDGRQDCDEDKCEFYMNCVEKNINEWKRLIISEDNGKEIDG